MRQYWLKLYRYSHVVVYQAYAGLRNEIARTYIGVLWWLLEPTLNALTMYLVFGMLLTSRRPDFLPFLLIGTFSWQWFSGSVIGAAGSIIAKSGLMQQVYLPKIIFPLVNVLNNSWKFLFAFAVLILVVSLTHAAPGWAYAALPIVLFTQFLLNLAIGIPLCRLDPVFPRRQLRHQRGAHAARFCLGNFLLARSGARGIPLRHGIEPDDHHHDVLPRHHAGPGSGRISRRSSPWRPDRSR